ncbi:hypothetical protein OV450_3401 [Actinobacteria bacterium OV450]|nr:hypothetical protein OV450_3401 [Actinobacteria bacterium OV450]
MANQLSSARQLCSYLLEYTLLGEKTFHLFGRYFSMSRIRDGKYTESSIAYVNKQATNTRGISIWSHDHKDST